MGDQSHDQCVDPLGGASSPATAAAAQLKGREDWGHRGRRGVVGEGYSRLHVDDAAGYGAMQWRTSVAKLPPSVVVLALHSPLWVLHKRSSPVGELLSAMC